MFCKRNTSSPAAIAVTHDLSAHAIMAVEVSPMKAVEFETTLNINGQILLPADLSGSIPSGEPLRVVVMWETTSADAAWREAGRLKFEESYVAADAVYEQLAANDASNR